VSRRVCNSSSAFSSAPNRTAKAPEMQAWVLAAVDECLAVAFNALAAPLRPQPDDTGSAGGEGMAAQ
jgi:hypothetical protein